MCDRFSDPFRSTESAALKTFHQVIQMRLFYWPLLWELLLWSCDYQTWEQSTTISKTSSVSRGLLGRFLHQFSADIPLLELEACRYGETEVVPVRNRCVFQLLLPNSHLSSPHSHFMSTVLFWLPVLLTSGPLSDTRTAGLCNCATCSRDPGRSNPERNPLYHS